jgi:hypothetical protein
VNTAKNVRVPLNVVKLSAAAQLAASQEELSSIELIHGTE